jgi:hypothetical protein
MPLAPHRQTVIDAAVTALNAIPGVKAAWGDDFDSSSVNVFLTLDDCNSRSGSFMGRKPYSFHPALGKQPIRGAKNAIKKALKTVLGKTNFDITEWPKLEYRYIGGGITSKDGYDGDRIGLVVYV